MIKVNEIVYKNFNERDIELPVLVKLVYDRAPTTFLDVGAKHSSVTYAPVIRPLVSQYDAIDIENDEQVASIVDRYYTQNVSSFFVGEPYDFVSCISTIEHVGLTSYKTEHEPEKRRVFERLLGLTKKDLYLTFPFGAPGVYPNQYSNITSADLSAWEASCSEKGFQVDKYFYYNSFPQGQQLWNHIDQVEAAKVSLNQSTGVQCVCLFHAHKDN
jgi:hypothetical protein